MNELKTTSVSRFCLAKISEQVFCSKTYVFFGQPPIGFRQDKGLFAKMMPFTFFLAPPTPPGSGSPGHPDAEGQEQSTRVRSSGTKDPNEEESCRRTGVTSSRENGTGPPGQCERGGEIFGGAPRIAQEPARDSPATVMGTHHDGEDYNNYFHICEEANNDEGNPSCDDDDRNGGSYDEFLFHLDSEVTKEIYETEYKPDVNMKWLTQGIVPVESKDAERPGKLLALSNTEQRARKGLVDAERIWEGHLQPVTTPAPPSPRRPQPPASQGTTGSRRGRGGSRRRHSQPY